MKDMSIKTTNPLEPDYNIPPPPSDFDEEAQIFYREHAPYAKSLGLLSQSDYRAFYKLCVLEGRFEILRRVVQEEGEVIDSGRGKMENPSFAAMMKILTQLRALYNVFGLTPSSRYGLTTEKKLTDDPLKVLFSIDE